MPSPVSSISSTACSCSALRRTDTRPPAGVNFSALEIKLPVICCSRALSPHSGSGSGGSVVDRVRRLSVGGFLEGLDRAPHRVAEIQRLEPQRELAVHDPREVEQVVHQSHLLADVAVDRLQRPRRQLVEAAVAAQDLGPAEDRLQRRAQLVRQRRDELILQAIGVLGGLARGLQLRPRPLVIGHVLPGDQHRLDEPVRPSQGMGAGPQLTATGDRMIEQHRQVVHGLAPEPA